MTDNSYYSAQCTLSREAILTGTVTAPGGTVFQTYRRRPPR